MRLRRDDVGITGNNAYLITAIVIVIVIFGAVAYVMVTEEGEAVVTGDLEFTVSLEDSNYDMDETILLTLSVTNGMDSAVNVSEFWVYGTIYLHVYNSTGEEVAAPNGSLPGAKIQARLLQPGETYSDSLNLTDYYHSSLWAESYTVNATYVNRHCESTVYLSNTLSFAIGWPDNCGAVASFQPLDMDELKIFCEVADNHSERTQGLMYRTELGGDRGMLFVFNYPLDVSFWMKNTLIPLDIVFIDEDGFVTNVEQADPEPGVPDSDLTRYHSDGPILYVVEMNQGLAAANGIHTDTYVNITYMP